jgi:ABC-type nitrate/sulfonate/bicarbonate transport system permease component
MALGILCAYLLHFVSIATRFIDVIDAQVAASRAIPVIAVLPLFVVWFGFGETGRILIIALSAMLYYLAPLHNAYRLLPRAWTILREQRRMPLYAYYWCIVIPGTLGTLLGAIRLTFSIAFTIGIASEYLGAETGLGKVIDAARVTFNVPGIFVAIIVASVLGFVVDWVIVKGFDAAVHWAGAEGKK